MFGIRQSSEHPQSGRLRRLQKRVSPRFETDGISTTHYISELCASGGIEMNDEFQKYVHAVCDDPRIENLAERYRLTTRQFARIYRLLCSAGLNRWNQDRNLALEALADYDALLFVIGCKRREVGNDIMVDGLERYFAGQLRKHEMAQIVRSNSA